MKKRSGKTAAPKSKPKPVKTKTMSYSARLKKALREKEHQKDAKYTYKYHQNAFGHFIKLMHSAQSFSITRHRVDFWRLVSDGIYGETEAKELLSRYKGFLEDRMKAIVGKYCIHYWLHVSRRIAPWTMGDNKDPDTIAICRYITMAAIQKYGQLSPCELLKPSASAKIEEVFKGLFLTPAFENELPVYQRFHPDLVLTEFDEHNLAEYFDLELLAYEMWYAGSKSRIIGKGANLVVDHQTTEILLDDRSDELDWLLINFDARQSIMESSATGVVFTKIAGGGTSDIVLTDVLCDRRERPYSNVLADLVGLKFTFGELPNFDFVTFEIAGYLKAHSEYAEKFQANTSVRLEYVLALIAYLSMIPLRQIIEEKDLNFTTKLLTTSILSYSLEKVLKGMELSWKNVLAILGTDFIWDEEEIRKVFGFLMLNEQNQQKIFVDSFGPIRPLMPGYTGEEILVDMSGFNLLLANLFSGIKLLDTGFKGQLLEDAINTQPSALPTTLSRAIDGSTKQVDYAIASGDLLILVECKAVAVSFGIYGGQTSALDHRRRNVIDKGLNDVDRKVKWFRDHPVGTNYDISKFKHIVGIAVSAFVEFMPTREDKYWLNSKLPRVLTIREFETLRASDMSKIIKKNLLPVN